MGKCEKLFTKLTELMVGEWWRRLGGTYHLPTKKSGTEDVELIYDSFSIVCDAKVFRLGRSQKAPNVKDFLKLASVRLWIENLNKTYQSKRIHQTIKGGLVTYSSLHEWESDSEVYEECTNHATPVVMLPYEVLALLLTYKEKICIPELLDLWEYENTGVTTARQKSNYWAYITKYICALLSISEEQYATEMKDYHRRILEASTEYRKIVQATVDTVRAQIQTDLDRITTLDEMKAFALAEIEQRDNALALDYLKHIDEFRYYRDQR